jgi:hypothetical protein
MRNNIPARRGGPSARAPQPKHLNDNNHNGNSSKND